MYFILFLSCWCSIWAISDSLYLYSTEYIEVQLDQFSFANNRTFKLRYLINDSYWEPHFGPIFFYPGNEDDIRLFSQNTGFMWEAAKQLRAMIVFAEHRYYGTSLPFGKESLTKPENFGYLTSQQALADFVDVINHIKYTRKRKSIPSGLPKTAGENSNPVIAFGGSYGGMLAAWMRMKYPAIVEGCLASSAPIWSFTGMMKCNAFYEKVTNTFHRSSKECVTNIRKSWNVIDKMTSKKNGRTWIFKNWKLCKPLKTKEDVHNLKNWLMEVYGAAAMVNYPYPHSFLRPLPGNIVTEICKPLTKSLRTKRKLLRGILKGVSVYLNYTGTSKCFDWADTTYVYGDSDFKGWYIQACLEMVMPFCTDGKTDMFQPTQWNFGEYAEYCHKTYGIYPQEKLMEKIYGGKSIESASNIIFSNGDLDPWACGGVTKSVSQSVTAVILSGAAHHLDLRASHPKDPRSVVNARKLYIKTFQKWIQNYHKRHKNMH